MAVTTRFYLDTWPKTVAAVKEAYKDFAFRGESEIFEKEAKFFLKNYYNPATRKASHGGESGGKGVWAQ